MGNDDDYTHTTLHDDWQSVGAVAASIVDRLKLAPERAGTCWKHAPEVSGGNALAGTFARSTEGNHTRSSDALASEMVGRADKAAAPLSEPSIAEIAAQRGMGSECEIGGEFSALPEPACASACAASPTPNPARRGPCAVEPVLPMVRFATGFSCATTRADGVAQIGACVKGGAIIGSGRLLLDGGLAGAGSGLRGLAGLGVDLQQRGGREAELLGDLADGLGDQSGDDSGRVILARGATNGGRGGAEMTRQRQQALDIGLRDFVLLCGFRGAGRQRVFENRPQFFEIDGHLFYLQLCGASGRHTVHRRRHREPLGSHGMSRTFEDAPRLRVRVLQMHPQMLHLVVGQSVYVGGDSGDQNEFVEFCHSTLARMKDAAPIANETIASAISQSGWSGITSSPS